MDTLQSLCHLPAPHLSPARLRKGFVLPVPGCGFKPLLLSKHGALPRQANVALRQIQYTLYWRLWHGFDLTFAFKFVQFQVPLDFTDTFFFFVAC